MASRQTETSGGGGGRGINRSLMYSPKRGLVHLTGIRRIENECTMAKLSTEKCLPLGVGRSLRTVHGKGTHGVGGRGPQGTTGRGARSSVHANYTGLTRHASFSQGPTLLRRGGHTRPPAASWANGEGQLLTGGRKLQPCSCSHKRHFPLAPPGAVAAFIVCAGAVFRHQMAPVWAGPPPLGSSSTGGKQRDCP